MNTEFTSGMADSVGRAFGAYKKDIKGAYASGYVDPNTDIFGGLNAPTTGGPRSTQKQQQNVWDNETDKFIKDPRSYVKRDEQGNVLPRVYSSEERASSEYSLMYEYADEDQQADMMPPLATPYGPSALSDIPTSTTNYRRPRTVAAGWEPNYDGAPDGTLTVVFRDGSVYNFYDVPLSEWLSFHQAISKGKNYLNPKNAKQASDGILLKYRHGPADVSALDPRIREMVYRAARTKQIYYGRKNEKAGGKGHYQYVTKTKYVQSAKTGYVRMAEPPVRKRVRTFGFQPNMMNPASKPNTSASKPTTRNTSAHRKK
jgi:hypothetical protein